jgi:hypothetical protein
LNSDVTSTSPARSNMNVWQEGPSLAKRILGHLKESLSIYNELLHVDGHTLRVLVRRLKIDHRNFLPIQLVTVHYPFTKLVSTTSDV